MTYTAVPMTASPTVKPENKGKPVVFPAKVLQKISASLLSGRFTFTDPNDRSISWQLYAGNGQIHYVNSLAGQSERLNYLLRRAGLRMNATLSANQTDYQWLCQLWKNGTLNLPQLRKILFFASQEALVHLLSLPQAEVEFDRALGLDNLVLSVPIRQIVAPLRDKISDWAQLRTVLCSPLQRLTLTDPNQLQQYLWDHSGELSTLSSLPTSLVSGMCFYTLAESLKMPTYELAIKLKPLFGCGVIKITPFAQPEGDHRPVVACIDDSKTVQRNVRLILETSGYQVMGLTEPARAIAALARQKPDLVLMDITMPEVDGYELCRMLRQSDQLKDVPIVMLTGRDGLIDRIRARMVGATDYLTKPFTPQELLTLANRFAHQPSLASA